MVRSGFHPLFNGPLGHHLFAGHSDLARFGKDHRPLVPPARPSKRRPSPSHCTDSAPRNTQSVPRGDVTFTPAPPTMVSYCGFASAFLRG